MAKLLVNIDVDDLERGVAFYTNVFELAVGRRLGATIVELLGAGAPIYVIQQQAGTAPFESSSAGRDYRRHWTPVHLDFVVSDLDAVLHRAEAEGAKREGDIGEASWGRIARLSDPFGHGVCLVEFSARGYDEMGAS